MKLFAVFAAVLAVAVATPVTPTTVTLGLQDITAALEDPNTPTMLVPYLEQALNEMMYALHHGIQLETITVPMPYIATWTLPELTAALEDPSTNPAHIPYLEAALNEMMLALWSGHAMDTVTIVMPIDDITPAPVIPMPVFPLPEVPEPTPVSPAPVEPTPAASSPLVQIIVNVNSNEQVVSGPAAPLPDIVAVMPTPENVPADQDTVVDVIPVMPTPVGIPAGIVQPIIIPN